MDYSTAKKVNKPMCHAITYLAKDICESIGYDMGWDTKYPSKLEYVDVLGDPLYSNILDGHDSEMKDFYLRLTLSAVNRLIGDSY
tara:strand:- start:3576 stop:3830 length:255 start_codon:yes stop_codon:yes gene_type:complete